MQLPPFALVQTSLLVVCDMLRYAPQALANACLDCGVGQHTNNVSVGASTCSSCDAGASHYEARSPPQSLRGCRLVSLQREIDQ